MQATSKGSDQTAHMRRLIWGFADHTYHIVGNIMSRLICSIIAIDDVMFSTYCSGNQKHWFCWSNTVLWYKLVLSQSSPMHCWLKVFFSFDLGNLWPNCQHITQYQNTLTSGVFSNKGMSYIYLFRYQVAGILFTLVNLTFCILMDSSYFVFCLFDLILYVPSTIYQLIRDGSSWVDPVLSKDKCVLLKGFFL